MDRSSAQPKGQRVFIEPDEIGERLRAERSRRGLSQRKLAQLVGVSPSLISQMESGKVQPSVATLMAVVTELGLSIDQLFRATDDADEATTPIAAVAGEAADEAESGTVFTTARSVNVPAPPLLVPAADDLGPSSHRLVQRGDDRSMIRLNGGVVWERLTPDPDRLVDFLHVTYEIGACSSDTNDFIRHEGREYLYLTSGRLEVQVVFEPFVLNAGDSIAFDSMRPHRLTNIGEVPAVAIVAVVHP